jgi:predicted lipoprotein with Yx(FWY)xxD motif
MSTRIAALSVLVGLLASGIAAAGAAPSRSSAATLVVRSSSYGRILFDGRGFALYAFTRDSRGRSACSGACATAWPPYIVKGGLRAGAGAKGSLLGTVRRANGARQVTYLGRSGFESSPPG